MMQNHWALLVLLVQIARCSENTINDGTISVPEPSWGYKCITEVGCQRSDQPITLTNTTLFESLDLCRTVCGRFGGIWPKPLTAAISMQTVKIHPNYLRFDLIDVPAEARAILVKMTHVVSANLWAECGGNVTEVVDTPVVVYMSVKSSDTSLTWNTDEQYTMDVQIRERTVAVRIFAETIYGARHGLETFTQLVASDRPNFPGHTRCGLRLVSGAKVRDKPVYKHRGLTLDTSRNFIPLKDIKRTLDGMAATKMNVFHWHVTDSHSFPLESSRVPQFTRYGAYSESEIYSTEEVKELIEYAQVRGIRVVIEIDAPAHAGNGWQWGKQAGHGDLAVCVNEKNWRKLCIQPPCGQLNPANPAMYRVLKDLYRDIAEVLPKPALFHMGGDEVYFGCWNSSEEIVSYMRDKGFETTVEGYIRLWAEFHAKALQIWDEQLKEVTGEDVKQPVMLWSSELTNPQRIQRYLDKERDEGLKEVTGENVRQPVMLWFTELTNPHRIQRYLDKERYIIQVWEPIESPDLIQLIRLGYRVVSVPKNVWYLDHGFWGRTKFANWRRMYAHMLPNSETGVLGGEVAMWTEYVDRHVLDTRIWPRAAAVAERLWADPTLGASAAEPRLQRLRSRLISRGLQPDALSPAWCSQNDGRCL